MDISGDSLIVEQQAIQLDSGGAVPTSPLQLKIMPINSLTAMNFYKKWHYLKNQEFISQWDYGAYYDGVLQGAISFGPPSALETIKGLFGSENQFGIFEIKRLAMNDACPKNSESRFIAMAIKLLKKTNIVKAIITYADTAMNHRGTIYKASGFTYKGLTAPKNDYWVNGKIQQRGTTSDKDGEWRPRSRKHLFIKLL